MWKTFELKEFFEGIRPWGKHKRLQMKAFEFQEFVEGMKEKQKQLEEGNAPLDDAVELLSQKLRRVMGCPDQEELWALVEGRLKEQNFRRWQEVWNHEQIERCPNCNSDIKDLEAILPPTKSAKPTTVGEILKRATRHHNLFDTLNYKREGKLHPISSKEMLQRARAVALGLYSLGVRRGDRVALMSDNCPEWTITDAGCQLTGVVDVAIPPNPPQGVAAQVRDALVSTGARVLFISDGDIYERIEEVIDDCTTLEHVVFFDDACADNPYMQEARALTLAQVEARGLALDAEQPTLAEELAQAVRPRDLATLIYTSGTTGANGKPKLVMLTQENLVSNILACFDHFSPMFSWRLLMDKSLFSLPMWHAPGRIQLYVHLYQGVRVHYAESGVYDEEPEALEKIWHNINEQHPTIVIGPPNVFKKIREGVKTVRAGEVKASLLASSKGSLLAWAVDTGTQWADCQVRNKPVSPILRLRQKLASLVFPRLAMGGRIRLLVSVERALPVELAWFFKGVGLPIVQGYGVTEASPVIAFGAPQDGGIVPDWRSLGNVEVDFSAKGELSVRGPSVMMGYYKRRDLTEEVFTEDGRLRTDDSGEWFVEGKSFMFEPHGMFTMGKERLEAAIEGLTYVDQAEIKSDDGRSLVAEIRIDYESLISDKQFKGIAASTEAELRCHPIVIKYFQELVDSLSECRTLNKGDVRVVIVKAIAETVTGKKIVPRGNALLRLISAWCFVFRLSGFDGRSAMQSQTA